MVINHLEKLFVTNDAATIIRELEVSYSGVSFKHAWIENSSYECLNVMIVLNRFLLHFSLAISTMICHCLTLGGL